MQFVDQVLTKVGIACIQKGDKVDLAVDLNTSAKDNVIDLKKPELFIDNSITDILTQGARRLLCAALETEVETSLEQYTDILDCKGWQRIVRNSYLPDIFHYFQ